MGYQWKGTHQGPDMFDATETPSKPTPAPKAGRELKPCGTHAAYFRHRRNGETPCDACMKANSDYSARMRGGRGGKIGNPRVAACGTDSGAKRHYARGEKACKECRDAANENRRRWKEARRAQIVDDQQAA